MDDYMKNQMTNDVIKCIAEDGKRMAKLRSMARFERSDKIYGYACALCRELKYPREMVDFREVSYQICKKLYEEGAA